MLVEDDNSLREIYQARLMAEGYETVAAKDGEEALALVGQEKPDLIILDIMMPKISGFDTLDILRSTPATKYTKVIMMSALSQAEDKARAEKLGADKYLVKSQVTLEDIVKTVKEVLDSDGDSSGADLDLNKTNLSTPTDTPVVPQADDDTAAPTPSSTQPDLSNAEAAVSSQAVSTADEEKSLTNEENKEMQDNTNDAAPTDPIASTPPADPSATPTPADPSAAAVDPVAEADSQVASDPSPLTDSTLTEPPTPGTTPADPTDPTPPADPPTPADPTPPTPVATPDPTDSSLGGTKVVDPVTDQNAQTSHLQDLLAQEESKANGGAAPTPPPTVG
jgi:DNA-binding response OmpR family regulator